MKQLKIKEVFIEVLGKMWLFELIDMKTKSILYKDSIVDEEEIYSYEEVNEAVQQILKTKGLLA